MNREVNYKFSNHLLKIVANIITWTFIVFMVITAIFLGYYLLASKISERKGTEFRPVVSLYTIISPSMVPNLKVYDVVVDYKPNVNNIKEGDIITFISQSSMSKGMTVTHRVSKVTQKDGKIAFQTKGDNNNSPDPALVTEEFVLGKVLFKIPQLGRLQFLLLGRGGWILLLIIPAIIIILKDILKIIRLNKVKNNMLIISDTESIDLDKLQREKEEKKKIKKKLLSEENNDTTIETDYNSRIVGKKKNKK